MRTLAITLLSSLAACGSNPGPEAQAPDSVAPEAAVAEVASPDVSVPERFCQPGALLGCSPDRLGATMCSAIGDRAELRLCSDDRGNRSFCDDGRGCLLCIPGQTRCRDDDLVEVCDVSGDGYVAGQPCTALGTSQVCYRGACVEMCEVAEKENSYMGCDY